jgi:hypothetical protein
VDNIMVAVGAVIVDKEGRILLVKHVPERNGYWQGKWICWREVGTGGDRYRRV